MVRGVVVVRERGGEVREGELRCRRNVEKVDSNLGHVEKPQYAENDRCPKTSAHLLLGISRPDSSPAGERLSRGTGVRKARSKRHRARGRCAPGPAEVWRGP